MEWSAGLTAWLVGLALLAGGAHAQGQSDIDDSLIVVEAPSLLTPKALKYVHQALAWLPRSVKERLLQAGVHVAVTPTLQELNGEEGACRFEPLHHRVVICERHHGSSQVNPRTPITTLHEIGHAYDFVLDHYSRSPEFEACYRGEATRVPEQDKALLKHFLQPGRRGASECFASLWAGKYFPGQDRRLNLLKADFPETFRLVQTMPD